MHSSCSRPIARALLLSAIFILAATANSSLPSQSDPALALVGARKSVEIPPNATTLDCTGLFITACFQNSHVHFTEEKWAGVAQN